ncbi:MAG: protein translocase subunit SecD [Planctomycetes bacterium]|nr:protein translocase subunit SecD [Planctomycetota bacterium]
MVPNLPRKLFGIMLVSILAVWSMAAFNIHLGLDLSGGSRIVYKVDFDEAIEKQQIGINEDRRTVLQQVASVFQRRLDSAGLADIPIYPQGEDQIVVELPDRTKDEIEQIKSIIVNQGSLSFRISLNATDDLGYATEIEKYRTWRTANPETNPTDFNRVPEAENGPRAGVLWYGLSENARPTAAPQGLDAVPVRNEGVIRNTTSEDPDSWDFTGADIEAVFPSQDRAARPAVGYKLKSARGTAYADFTEEFKGRAMAIILSGEVYSAPEIEGRIPGQGIITGGLSGFSIEEVTEFITVLRTGSLPVVPVLDSESFVGPSLGADSISTGVTSATIGLVAIFVFMLLYYWMNGVVACMALAFNAFVLIGALYFTQATLTLPGLAGLVLTIGMAVDANILIFERIREERTRGREVMQSYKNGYENAFSTIIDANLTTLITGVILFRVGTGPVAGFAATLSLGIVASMFSALVFSKVIMHFLVFEKRVIKDVKMARALWADKHIKFTYMRKGAAVLSAAMILGGIAMLTMQFQSMQGIDFAGGSRGRLHFSEAQSTDQVREQLTASGGAYKVVLVKDEDGNAGDSSKQFFIERTLTPEESAAYFSGETGGQDLQSAFQTELEKIFGGQLDPEDPFPELSTVSPRVSGEIQQKASLAMLLSLLSIVIYMNFRFKEYRYGIAAVIAVFHDVLVTLGLLALVSKLGLVQVELNLEMVAAFLTIIGYSLNDTIVVFDRVRENLPRQKGSYPEVIDLSINQSLSRTILTSLTTFFVVAVLFVMNRPMHNVLEGFSFAMLIGVVVGTYSSMFVASPALLFLDRWARNKRLPDAGDQEGGTSASAKAAPAS